MWTFWTRALLNWRDPKLPLLGEWHGEVSNRIQFTGTGTSSQCMIYFKHFQQKLLEYCTLEHSRHMVRWDLSVLRGGGEMAASILWSIFTSTSFLTLLLLVALAAISYHYIVKVGGTSCHSWWWWNWTLSRREAMKLCFARPRSSSTATCPSRNPIGSWATRVLGPSTELNVSRNSTTTWKSTGISKFAPANNVVVF